MDAVEGVQGFVGGVGGQEGVEVAGECVVFADKLSGLLIGRQRREWEVG